MQIVVDSINVKKVSDLVVTSFNDGHYADVLKGEIDLSVLAGKREYFYINAKQTIGIDKISTKLRSKLIDVLNEIEDELNEVE